MIHKNRMRTVNVLRKLWPEEESLAMAQGTTVGKFC